VEEHPFLIIIKFKTMTDIIAMLLLGAIAGMISGFWTRIIKKNMLFRKLGKQLELINNRHLIAYTCDSMVVKFIMCIFCLVPWLVFLFCTWYIVEYTPHWTACIIGVLGALGGGNFVAEIIHGIRHGE
jgi:hypothetical protein